MSALRNANDIDKNEPTAYTRRHVCADRRKGTKKKLTIEGYAACQVGLKQRLYKTCLNGNSNAASYTGSTNERLPINGNIRKKDTSRLSAVFLYAGNER